MRGRSFVIVLIVLALALLVGGLGVAADRAAIRDETTGMPGIALSPTTDLDDLFGIGTVTPEVTGTPDVEMQETVTPTTRAGSPTPQETVTPTVRAGSPTPQETRTPTIRAGSPTPQETGTPTVPAASPTPQDMEDQQLVQILPQIYDQFECYDTVTTVRWELDNGSEGVAVITGKVVTDPLAERWDIIVRRQGQTATVIEVVRADGETYARTVSAFGTSGWGNISPETVQALSQFSWIADLSALLDLSEGEFVGQATINDFETNHFRYTREDFQLEQQDFELEDASADVWFSTEYNIPVRTTMDLEGTNILGTTGDVVVQSQLTNINENCDIQLPQVLPMPTEQVQPTPTAQADEDTELVLADALGLSEFESYRLQSNFDWTPRNARGFSGQLNAQVTYDTPAEFASLALQGVRAAAFPAYVEYVNYQGEMYLRIGMDGEWVSAEDADLTHLIRQLGEAINPTDFLQTQDCELIEENVEISGQMTDHYRCVTQNVTGEPFFRRLSQATVDIWRVQGSDAYVRMNMSVQAETAQGMSGVLNLRANVTDIGEPVNIQEPELGSTEGVVTPPTTGTPTVPPTGTTTPTRTGTPAGTPTGAVTGTPTGTATLPASPTATRTGTATPRVTPTGTRTPTRTGTPAGTATLPLSPTITRTGTAAPTVTPTAILTITHSMGQLPWDDDDVSDSIDQDEISFVMQPPTPEQQPQVTPTVTQATPSPSAPQQMTACPLPFIMPCDNFDASYVVDVSPEQVLQFYEDSLTQMGWTQVDMQVENGLVFEMEGQELLVIATQVDGRTIVHLTKLPGAATPAAGTPGATPTAGTPTPQRTNTPTGTPSAQ